MLIKLIAIMLLAALLLPMLGGIRRIRDLPRSGRTPDPSAAAEPDATGEGDIRND
ncbi:MAG: hypothetical protein JWL91_201 [Sphingomonas bacterium]|nr:hypothetical protein [Sphingomonas bacterium]MDB5688325.1 hypothetical protein [Sphingomonas bacterium]